MNTDEFLARIDRQLQSHFGWEEHENASWTTGVGGQRSGEPDFSHKCEVVQHLTSPVQDQNPTLLSVYWWKWTAKIRSGSVSFRARGYAKSREEGKTACERAVRMLALAIVTQFKAEH